MISTNSLRMCDADRVLNCHTTSALCTLAARLKARTILAQETAARMMSLCFLFLEYAGELRIFVLRRGKKSNYNKTTPHLGPEWG
jgi:hypothetical protein